MIDPQVMHVQMDGAGRRFGDVEAVRDVSFSMAPGTILGLIGPSGSGKTTIIRMLTGTLSASEGEIRVLDEDPRRFRARTRERIGYVPQNFVLYPDLTAAENVGFVASLFGMLGPSRGRRVRAVLELLDLWEARDRLAGQLSGGMQRRLALATALVHEPDVLFVDEPTAGVDPLLRSRIWDEIVRLRDAGRTLLVTTQYIGEAERCDAVALLWRGQLLAVGQPDELRQAVFGGQILEVRTTRPVDPADLRTVDGVVRVDALGPRTLRAVVADPARATPRIVDALRSLGNAATAMYPHEPTLDDVFHAVVAAADEQGRAA